MREGRLRNEFGTVDLKELERGLNGKPFNRLVETHLLRLGRDLEVAALGMIEALEPHEQPIVESMIDFFNEQAHDPEFWGLDSARVLSWIEAHYLVPASAAGHSPSKVDVFNAFQIVVLHFAREVRDQEALRVHARIQPGRGASGVLEQGRRNPALQGSAVKHGPAGVRAPSRGIPGENATPSQVVWTLVIFGLLFYIIATA